MQLILLLLFESLLLRPVTLSNRCDELFAYTAAAPSALLFYPGSEKIMMPLNFCSLCVYLYLLSALESLKT